MNRPMRTRGGAVIQAGLDPRPRGSLPPSKMPTTGVYRAIVLNTYVPDEEASLRGVGVECDVLLVKTLMRLPHVPVRQHNHGRNNAWAPWVPKPCTRTISTGQAVNFTTRDGRGNFQNDASLLSELDGDLVTVEFIDHDPDFPLITGALTHEQSLRVISGNPDDADASLGWKEGDYRQGSPRRNELFFAHAGAELRINGQGDVLVSSVAATDDPVNEDASAAVGQVRIRVKDSQRFTVEIDGTDVLEVWKDGAQVKIDLGEGAGERLVLGDSFRDFINNTVKTYIDGHTHLPGTFTVTIPGSPPTVISVAGASGAPVSAMPTMAETLLSDLARTKRS